MKNGQKYEKVNKNQCNQWHFDRLSIAFQRGQNASQTSINAGQSIGDIIVDIIGSIVELNGSTRRSKC